LTNAHGLFVLANCCTLAGFIFPGGTIYIILDDDISLFEEGFASCFTVSFIVSIRSSLLCRRVGAKTEIS
jgi:hypothetical protein